MFLHEYDAEPRGRRKESTLTPSTSFVSLIALLSTKHSARTATHRPDDLHSVPFAEQRRRVGTLRRDLAVHRHRGELALDAQVSQEAVDAEAVGDLVLLTVHDDLHKQNGRAPRGCGRNRSGARRVPFAGI